jgi:uncharacterized protein
MKKTFLIVSILLLSGSAFCQVSDSYKATVKKMLHATGTEATFAIAIKQIVGMYKQQKTNVPPDVWEEMEKQFAKTSVDELVEMLAPVYHNHFTEDDLKKMLEFYDTPVGKKYAEKTPLIMQESMQVGQQWGMKLAQQFAEKLKEKGY